MPKIARADLEYPTGILRDSSIPDLSSGQWNTLLDGHIAKASTLVQAAYLGDYASAGGAELEKLKCAETELSYHLFFQGRFEQYQTDNFEGKPSRVRFGNAEVESDNPQQGAENLYALASKHLAKAANCLGVSIEKLMPHLAQQTDLAGPAITPCALSRS